MKTSNGTNQKRVFFLVAVVVLFVVGMMISTPSALAYDDEITTFNDLISHFRTILDIVVPFLVALGVFIIIYGVFGYLSHAAEEEKRAEAKLFIVWGVIGIFIMVSIWGFVSILVNTIPLERSAPGVPSVFPGAI